jgi:DNA-binding MurR/RpiR family transcriptional regulator
VKKSASVAGSPAAPAPVSASFLARVRDGLDKLHPTEKKLAEFVLDFPGELASYSASELAQLAGVSNATVTRFIKKLDYQNYDEARRQVREEKQTGSPLFLTGRSAGVEQLFEAHIEQGQENLRKTFARFGEQQISAIAEAVLAARKVWVTGFRSSHAIASYFRWQIFQVKEDIHVVPNAGDTLGEYMASATKQDVFVIFGLRRRPARLRDIIAQAVKSGAKVLYITDEPVARRSDVSWHIHCACAAPGPLDNHASVIALCHLLANRVIELSGSAGRERLTAIEASHSAFDEMQ